MYPTSSLDCARLIQDVTPYVHRLKTSPLHVPFATHTSNILFPPTSNLQITLSMRLTINLKALTCLVLAAAKTGTLEGDNPCPDGDYVVCSTVPPPSPSLSPHNKTPTDTSETSKKYL